MRIVSLYNKEAKSWLKMLKMIDSLKVLNSQQKAKKTICLQCVSMYSIFSERWSKTSNIVYHRHVLQTKIWSCI